MPEVPVSGEEDEVVSNPLRDMEMIAFEGIKDRINRLDWDEMQNLVAGVLRSMGYKTRYRLRVLTAKKTSLLRLTVLASKIRASLLR